MCLFKTFDFTVLVRGGFFWEKYTKRDLWGAVLQKVPTMVLPTVNRYIIATMSGMWVCVGLGCLITTSFTNIEVLQLSNFPSFQQPLAQLS